MNGAEAQARWLAETEVVSGYFESAASRWATRIRAAGGESFFWDGLGAAQRSRLHSPNPSSVPRRHFW